MSIDNVDDLNILLIFSVRGFRGTLYNILCNTNSTSYVSELPNKASEPVVIAMLTCNPLIEINNE